MPQLQKPDGADAAPPPGHLPMMYRALSIETVNPEKRTFDIIWTTGASVRRYDWREGENYDEVLVVDTKSCDLSRLNGGAPFLRDHNAWSINAILGAIDRAWIEGGNGHATIRFPAEGVDPEADKIFLKIAGKIIRNISVGYIVRGVQKVAKDGQVTQWRIIDWQPYEISAVAVGADAGAGTRAGESAQFYPFHLVNRAEPTPPQETLMEKDENAPAGAGTETRVAPAIGNNPGQQIQPAPVVEQRAAPQAPAATEHAWAASDIAKITQRAAAFGLSASDAIAVMGEARSIDAATDALQARAVAKQQSSAPRQQPQVRVLVDEGDTQRAAIETAILHRANPDAAKMTDAARQWRGMSLLEMGRTFMEETQGASLRGLSKMELAGAVLGMRGGMHSTSDFANILANIASKRLRDAYGTAVQTWKPFCRPTSLPDFKEKAIVALTGLPELKKVREGQEYTYAKLGDTAEKYSLATYGRVISITRQALINDDLGAFDRLPTLFGRAASELESDIVWGIILDNPNMADGTPLFHADHKNLAGSGAAPSEATLEAMDIAMGAQVDAAGKPLNLRTKYLAVSRKHKVAAQKLLFGISASKSSDVNVYQNSMDLIVEDRLYNASGACKWLTIGDPSQWDTIEYAYLEGEQGLYTEQRIGFEVDGLEIKGRLDFAAKAIDYKAFQLNPGN